MKNVLIFLFLLIFFSSLAFSQENYKSASRYDYYTTENAIELVVWVPESKSGLDISIDVVLDFDFLIRLASVEAGKANIFVLPIDRFQMGRNELTVSYNEHSKWVGADKVEVILLEDHYNAVKIDRLSGGLIVEGMPFIPFGFYAYSPVQPTLAEEEVVKGFNMMSPYQKIEGKTLKERKKYMDRCASLGMKVNYNLLSLAGGGGVGHRDQEKMSHRKRMKILRKEIEAFRDHPALLSWYISDEPVGQGVPADSLVESYDLIKKLDPYHPVTVVFMSPWMAGNYSHVMDIVMADPYPIPHGSVSEVGQVADMLNKKFFLEKTVWIVPQAFGGNEWWEREPTAKELRAMTYLGIVNNARGMQYFIRHGLNAFPKSTIAWNECAAIALEIAELTPYFFSAEARPKAISDQKNIQFAAFSRKGHVAVIAVNADNEPKNFSFNIEDLEWSGKAMLPFENREVEVKSGAIEDIIDGYGSRVYLIPYQRADVPSHIREGNVMHDPGFENITGTGVPASCYARPAGDRGATYFIDSRTSFEGDHSLRLNTPKWNEGINLSFMRVYADPKRSYTMSIMAKAIPLKYRDEAKKKFWNRLCGCGPDREDFPMFTISFRGTEESFIPDEEWKEYSYTIFPGSESGSKYPPSPGLRLDDKGAAWFDLIQLYPDMSLTSGVSPGTNEITIDLSTIHEDAEIYYSLGFGLNYDIETDPVLYDAPFAINTSCKVKASTIKDGVLIGSVWQEFMLSLATGCNVSYGNAWSPKYTAAKENALLDGIIASSNFKDKNWQGFEGEDLDVVIDLGEKQEVQTVMLRFLSNKASWIFLPVNIKVYWSDDGKNFSEYATFDPNTVLEYVYTPDPYIEEYLLHGKNVDAKYIRIVASGIGTCPEGHPGEGGKAWLFTDEIVISDKKLIY